jgi:hypothetical protein
MWLIYQVANKSHTDGNFNKLQHFVYFAPKPFKIDGLSANLHPRSRVRPALVYKEEIEWQKKKQLKWKAPS